MINIKMKNIVIAGCSMSTDVTSLDSGQKNNSTNKNYLGYPYFINERRPNKYNLYNAGRDAADNGTIMRNLVDQVNSIEDKGLNVDFALIQWSGSDRASKYIEARKEWSLSSFHGVTIVGEDREMWEKYFAEEHTEEQGVMNTLDNIFMSQQFLKSKNIKYKMFCGWDLFTDSGEKDIFSKDISYENIDNKLLKDKFCHCQIDTHNSQFGITDYWDMIDWDNWWFFSNDKIKYGGLTEWSQYNLEKDKWYQDDLHPSFEAHKKFKDDIILKIIDEEF